MRREFDFISAIVFVNHFDWYVLAFVVHDLDLDGVTASGLMSTVVVNCCDFGSGF